MRLLSTLGLVLITAIAFSCGGDDSSSTDAPPTIDSPPTIDAPPPADAPPPDASGSSINCGTATCDTATQECCVDNGGAATCVATGSCVGVGITCDGPEDCGTATDACCGTDTGAACAPPDGGMCDVELCHTPDDCSMAGNLCCPTPIAGISVCAPGPTCPG